MEIADMDMDVFDVVKKKTIEQLVSQAGQGTDEAEDMQIADLAKELQTLLNDRDIRQRVIMGALVMIITSIEIENEEKHLCTIQ